MLKNEILNVDGTNWLIREATNYDEVHNAIAAARVTGSIGGRHAERLGDGPVTVLADVVRLNDDGTECLPYGEKGGTDHSALVALAKLRADYDQLGRALNQANLRNRVYAGALAQIDAWVTAADPCYHEAEFLRTIITKEITEAHATIAEARAAAKQGQQLAPTDLLVLAPEARGLDLNDSADREHFRVRVALRLQGYAIEVIRRWVSNPARDRDTIVRAIADAYIAHACAAK